MAVREGLLALLAEGPRYGYQLKTGFEAVTGGVWPLNVGQVYTTLDRLARDQLVTVDDSDEQQKSYALTDAGREELLGWWDELPADGPPPRDELLLKVLLAAARGPDHALDVITRNRTALTGLLQTRRRASRARPADDDPAAAMSAQMVDDALITRTESDLRWLDQCESRILTVRGSANGNR